MTTPPGWYPDPSGAPGQRYWDGEQWTDGPVAPEAKHRMWPWIVAAIVALFIVVGMINGDGDTTATETATETSISTPTPEPETSEQPEITAAPPPEVVDDTGFSDEQIAADAEQYMKASLGFEGAWPEYAERCLNDPTLDPARCWQPFVADFTYRSGILRVALQVDRSDPFDQEVGENAAQHIARFIGAANEPWSSDVDWVETTDGAGVHISDASVW